MNTNESKALKLVASLLEDEERTRLTHSVSGVPAGSTGVVEKHGEGKSLVKFDSVKYSVWVPDTSLTAVAHPEDNTKNLEARRSGPHGRAASWE